MGNRLYFIAIVPPEGIQKLVNEIKNEFSRRFNSKHALKSPPHITLIPPFKWDSEKESKLLEHIGKVVASRSSLKICIDGFGAFPSRVIYLNIQRNIELNFLQEVLKSELDSRIGIVKLARMGRTFKPHMTVAFRDLKKEKYPEAWREFGHRSFKQDFNAQTVSLLKHDGGKWEIIKNFEMKE